MEDSIFRNEVFAASQRGWLGTVSLVQPLKLRWLSGVAMLTALAVVAFGYFGHYAARARVSGELVPDMGLAVVVAPTDGVVTSLLAKEGAVLSKNAEVGVVDVPRSAASGSDLLPQTRYALAQRRTSLLRESRSRSSLLDEQAEGYRTQLAQLRQELAHVGAELSTRREQVRIARGNVERFRAVVNDGYVSDLQFKQQQQSALELLAQQQSLERQDLALRRNISGVEQSLAELGPKLEEQRAALDRDLAELEEERLQREVAGSLMIKAPLSGSVTHRMVEAGQAVKSGQPLISILPAGSKLEAHLRVSSRNIGFVELGDDVLLRYSAYPYQKFGHFKGKVTGVSRSPAATGAASAEPLVPTEPYYRVIVSLERQSVSAYGRQEQLWPGIAVEADILGDRRRLYEWIFEPLYAAGVTMNP